MLTFWWWVYALMIVTCICGINPNPWQFTLLFRIHANNSLCYPNDYKNKKNNNEWIKIRVDSQNYEKQDTVHLLFIDFQFFSFIAETGMFWQEDGSFHIERKSTSLKIFDIYIYARPSALTFAYIYWCRLSQNNTYQSKTLT